MTIPPRRILPFPPPSWHRFARIFQIRARPEPKILCNRAFETAQKM